MNETKYCGLQRQREQLLAALDECRFALAGAPVKHTHYRTVQADAETKACGVCDTVRIESKPGRDTWPADLRSLAQEFDSGRKLREYKRATTCRVCSL